ncbi:MAG TPA: glycoside hydrolase family 99-like domain-containing protein [Candidatus Omnitrophota bacterium]|nr:glycoside hydrolase family 99-like domain-containing protein [Candidatus Omnitrophota bacterium]
MMAEQAARLIAFYLPQYHPIPENDEWWGKGFTEWTNVMNAKPQYRGHDQPNQPSELGYYDLRSPEIREQQAQLAKEHGIEGFCYWHYWFNGKLLLERPVLDMLASGRPDIPFCLAWANEPWSRRWTGEPLDILQEQTYGGVEDHERHFEWLLPALTDRRAIKVDGKPLFLIYRADQVPDIRGMLARWRVLAASNGLPGLYFISIGTTGTYGIDTRAWGFDAVLEFQPNWKKCGEFMKWGDPRIGNRFRNLLRAVSESEGRIVTRIDPSGIMRKSLKRLQGPRIFDYKELWPYLFNGGEPSYPSYPCVFPRWDNSPRKGRRGLIVKDSDPYEYRKWLTSAIGKVASRPRDCRLVFINAWNEWAEGNYLEPDRKFGRAYLEATRDAISSKAAERI